MKDVEAIQPVSPAQQLMLTDSLRRETSTRLVSHFLFHIDHSVDSHALEAAWQSLIDRHQALRSCFVTKSEQHFQIVRGDVVIDYRYHHIPGGKSERGELIERLTQQELDEPLAIKRAPLMRVTLLGSDDCAQMIWTCHHLILDRQCLPILLGELQRAYSTQLSKDGRLGPKGRTHSPAPQFSDYLKWIGQQDELAAREFWSKELAGFKCTFATPNAADREVEFPDPFHCIRTKRANGLRSLARSAGTTLGSLFHGLLAIAIARMNETTDVLFVSTVSGRTVDLVGVEQIVGSFSNNVPFRMSLDETSCVSSFIRSAHQRTAARLPHEHVSLLQIADWMPQLVSQFDILLLFQPAQEVLDNQGALRLKATRSAPRSGFPITISIYDGEEIEIGLDVQPGFGPRARRVLLELKAVIGAILELKPDESIAPLLSAAPPQRDEVLVAAATTTKSAGNSETEGTLPPSDFPCRMSTASSSSLNLVDKLKCIWAELLGHREFNVEDDFFELGGRSFMLPRMLTRIHEETGVKIDMATFFGTTTIQGLATVLRNGDVPPRNDSLVVPLHESDKGIPVFWAPSDIGDVGGGWQSLNHDQASYAMRLPGWNGEEEPLTSVFDIAKRLIDDLRQFRPVGPYVLGGYCFGAVVAFEMARQLREAGEQISTLIILDSWCPRSGYRNFTVRTRAFMGGLRNLPRFLNDFSSRSSDEIKQDVYWMTNSLVSRAKTWFLPTEKSRETYFSMLSPGETAHSRLRRACFQAFTDYVPQVYAGNVLLCRAQVQPLICSHDPTMGWQPMCSGNLEVVEVRGNHKTMGEPPHIDNLRGILDEQLTRIGGK